MNELVPIDPETTTALEIRAWSVAVRDRISTMDVDELSQLEVLLRSVKARLQQLGSDIDEAERTRIRAVQRIGELLGPAERGGDRRSADFKSADANEKSGTERVRDHRARLLAKYPDVVDTALAEAGASLSTVVRDARYDKLPTLPKANGPKKS